MAKHYRKFTEEEKEKILQRADEIGTINILREYNLSYSVFYRWRQKKIKHSVSDQELIQAQKIKEEFEKLLEENMVLKKIVANQKLELEMKLELLNKKTPNH